MKFKKFKFWKYDYKKTRKLKDNIIRKILFGFGITAIIFILLIIVFLLVEGLPFFFEADGVDFFTGDVWDPSSPNEPRYGILPVVLGTFLVTLGAILIAVPIGIGCAVYLSEVAHPKIRETLKPIIEILAGIPSVVFGFFALIILSTWIDEFFNATTKLNALTGSIMLAVMMLPIIISLSEDAIRSVPREMKEASLALGLSKWDTIKGVVLPAALSGITAGIILGVARAIGETMTVLMATGNAPVISFDMLTSMRTMTATIAIEMGEVPYGSTHYHALFAIGIILFIITLFVNFIASIIRKRFRGRY
ncbi:MAG: phosphate ABC transporter permease subunit PstC [Thermoplasmatales archaeon]|jgi:phosphate transport system permease protein|nr:MAG: phosphate ABC transporter permease subunit PstC [Thermoplasmatales archaeon]